MTTRTYSSAFEHTSDATFRLWGSELASNLAAAGLVQTADTGQINWATVLRPATNVAGGYEIWRLPGSALYFKLEYGTGASAAIPQMWMTVGTGSDGAGALTGQLSTRNILTAGASPTSTVVAYTTYICVKTDYFGLCWKANSTTTGGHGGSVLVGRTVDANGVATTVGFGVYRQTTGASTPELQTVRTAATAVTLAASTFYSLVPGSVVSSVLQNGDQQAYLWFMNAPEVLPFLHGCTVIGAEVTFGTVFTIALVGASTHTYLSLQHTSGNHPANAGATAYSPAMMWE